MQPVKSADLHQDVTAIKKPGSLVTVGRRSGSNPSYPNPDPNPPPRTSPPLLGEERVVCFVCDFAVDRLLRQGWRTPERIITLVYTEMKTRKDGALACCQKKSASSNCMWRKSPRQKHHRQI